MELKSLLPSVNSVPLCFKSNRFDGGEVPTLTDVTGRDLPQHATYDALVPLEESAADVQVGMRGQARIRIAPRTLGQRLLRSLQRTFRFEL